MVTFTVKLMVKTLDELRHRVRGLRRLVSLVSADRGQDLLEYAMLGALISLVAVGAVTTLGRTVNTVLWQSIAAQF